MRLYHPASGRSVEIPDAQVAEIALGQVAALQEVVGRLLYQAGPITPDTPCRCGATQPAHCCDYKLQAEKDALALLPPVIALGEERPPA
jgi:hypothetical protein